MKLALKFLAAFVFLGVIFGVIAFIKAKQFSGGQAPVFPPAPVTSEEVAAAEWDSTLTAVGTLRAEQGIMVSSEVAGIVRKIHFVSGDYVEKGTLLVELDTEVEKANLESARARLDLAEISLKRAKRLLEQSTIAEAELDSAEATAKEARASVASIEALVDRKKIHAPFSGRLGIREVDEGQFIAVGESIVPLQALDPIKVDFTMPQTQLGKLKPGYSIKLVTDAYDEVFTGELTAVDPEVGKTSRAIRYQGTLQNSDEKLIPGMYAQVSVIIPEKREVAIIPQTAIYYQSFGNTVFVINKNESGDGLVLEQRFVQTGEKRGDYVEITKGLEPGEKVVTTGVFKLRNGQPAIINNSVVPDFETNPNPENS